ncbi:MAG: hypothetical protein KUG58_09290 [Marinosulfonomonas sp.]|nr:hypothetical protein [Marinosulfonomonas sp.]
MAEKNNERPWNFGSVATAVIWAIGLGLIGLSVSALFTSAPFGMAPKSLWYLSVIGLATCLVGYFGSHGGAKFGCAAAALFLGGGAHLWLTQPLWFPALTFNQDDPASWVMLTAIGAQSMVCLALFWQKVRLGPIMALIQTLGPVRITVFLLLSTAFSVSVMGYVPRQDFVTYAAQIIAGGCFVVLTVINIAALILHAPRATLKIAVPALVAIAFGASALLAWFAFQRLPHVQDEVAYLFQARTFAHGTLAISAPPEGLQTGLEFYLLTIRDDLWFSTTPPGWSGVLMIGVLVNAPWLVNPVLSAIIVWLAYSVAACLTTRRAAALAALLIAMSPWFLASSGSLMPHNTAIACILAAWRLLLARPIRTRALLLFALLAGFFMGWVFVTRQLDGVLIGLATAIWLLFQTGRPQRFMRVTAFCAGCIVTGSAFLFFNFILTGDALLAPLAEYLNTHWTHGANSYGFGPEIGPPEGWGGLDIRLGHTPFEGVINTANNIASTQFEYLGWACGSLALVTCLFLWGQPNRVDKGMIALSLLVVVAMFFYWFAGSFYIGPRYWFSLLFPLLILSVSGFDALSNRLQTLGVQPEAMQATLLVLCLFGLLVFTPWRGVEKYFGYQKYSPHYAEMRASGDFGNALVFIKQKAQFGSAFLLNDPGLPDDAPIFLRDLGEVQNARAIAVFPDRPIIYHAWEFSR